ncbi:hypothetical protein N9J83_09620, partial [Opitutales bacterium]|nr:hypothetical protein [Opitutales bacterium]
NINNNIYSKTVFFIDQPGLTCVNDINLAFKYSLQNDYKFYLVLHPRNMNSYSKFPIWIHSSNEIYSINSIIIGYSSTIFLFANIIKIPNYIIKKNSHPYIIDLQNYLFNNGTKDYNQLLA